MTLKNIAKTTFLHKTDKQIKNNWRSHLKITVFSRWTIKNENERKCKIFKKLDAIP